MILIKCLVKMDQSLEKQSEKKETKSKKQTNKQKELTATNEKLHENCKIVELYEEKTATNLPKMYFGVRI